MEPKYLICLNLNLTAEPSCIKISLHAETIAMDCQMETIEKQFQRILVSGVIYCSARKYKQNLLPAATEIQQLRDCKAA